MYDAKQWVANVFRKRGGGPGLSLEFPHIYYNPRIDTLDNCAQRNWLYFKHVTDKEFMSRNFFLSPVAGTLRL